MPATSSSPSMSRVSSKPSFSANSSSLKIWEARLMSDIVARERPQARQISMPSGKIFRHLGQVSSGIAKIDTNRQRVSFPSAAGSNASWSKRSERRSRALSGATSKPAAETVGFRATQRMFLKLRGRCFCFGRSSSTISYGVLASLKIKGLRKGHHIFPLRVLVREEILQCLEIRSFMALQDFIVRSALPSLVFLPGQCILRGLLPKIFLHPVVAMIRPKVLGLLAIECVNQAMIGDPVFADECSGQGFHQANAIMQCATGVDCQAQCSDTWVFSINFPGGMSCHIHVAFARRRTRENPGANDGLKRAPRRVVVDDAKLFRDLDFRQVWIDRDFRIKSSCKIVHREVIVQRAR